MELIAYQGGIALLRSTDSWYYYLVPFKARSTNASVLYRFLDDRGGFGCALVKSDSRTNLYGNGVVTWT